MNRRLFASVGVLAVVSVLATTVAGQKTWTPSRTPWGDPDLQGTWSSEAELSVPFERPAAFGNRLFLTDE